MQKATTTPVEELLSNTEAEEEEGRGPEGTVDTVTPTSKSVPTAVSTPTNSFEGVVPASTSKRKDITTKTSPYFNPTFHFTTRTQTTTSTELAKKSTTKKTTVAEELSKRINSTPVPKKKLGGASNIASGTQKIEDKQPEQPDVAKENLASLEALRDLTKRVEKIKTNIRKRKEELTVAHEERIRRQELREHERKEATEAAQSKRKIIEKQSTEKNKSSTEQEDSSVVPDSQQDPEVIEPTPPQDHQPSLTDSEVDKEN